MKKNIKLILILTMLITIFTCICLYIYMPKSISKNKYMKEIYVANYSNIEAYFLNVLGEKVERIEDIEKIRETLELIKNEKIRPVNFFEYDNIINGEAFRILIKSEAYEVKLIIGQDTISINSKLYKTDNNLFKLISEEFDEY